MWRLAFAIVGTIWIALAMVYGPPGYVGGLLVASVLTFARIIWIEIPRSPRLTDDLVQKTLDRLYPERVPPPDPMQDATQRESRAATHLRPNDPDLWRRKRRCEDGEHLASFVLRDGEVKTVPGADFPATTTREPDAPKVGDLCPCGHSLAGECQECGDNHAEECRRAEAETNQFLEPKEDAGEDLAPDDGILRDVIAGVRKSTGQDAGEVEKPTQCKKCLGWFVQIPGMENVSCCVAHSHGDCCHYSEKKVPAPTDGGGEKTFDPDACKGLDFKNGLEAIRKGIERGLYRFVTHIDPYDDEKWLVDAAMNGVEKALAPPTDTVDEGRVLCGEHGECGMNGQNCWPERPSHTPEQENTLSIENPTSVSPEGPLEEWMVGWLSDKKVTSGVEEIVGRSADPTLIWDVAFARTADKIIATAISKAMEERETDRKKFFDADCTLHTVLGLLEKDGHLTPEIQKEVEEYVKR
jgi:hypothetical protein